MAIINTPNPYLCRRMDKMDVSILVVLLIFMALFMGGGVMVVKGALARRKRSLYIGLLLLALCLVFLVVVKNIKGLY